MAPLIGKIMPLSGELAAELPRNRAPVILAGELRSRIRKVFGISVEERHGHGDDGMVAIVHLEGQADEPISSIVTKCPDLKSVLGTRRDDDFGQCQSFHRVIRGEHTIAEGGAATSPVVNDRDRTAGGPN